MARICAPALAFAAMLAPIVANAADPSTPAPAAIPPRSAAPVTLDLGAAIAVGGHLGDSPYFDVTARAGVALGLSAWLAPTPSFAVGLAYEHLGLGHERSPVGDLGTIDVDRSTHLVWLGLRLIPLRGEHAALYLELAPGLAFQHASANGLLFSTAGDVAPQPFSCSASGSADLGLRVGIGGELALSDEVHATLGGRFDNLRLSSDALGDCVSGIGSLSELSIMAGFSYRLDVTRIAR